MRNLIALLFCAALAATPLSAQNWKMNFDESKVGPYTLEDPLTFANGKKVRTEADWKLRRSELLELFRKEMYGQMPPAMPIYTETIEEGITAAGFGIRKQVRMWFREDKSGPHIDWLIVRPTWTKDPVPSIITLNFEGNHTVLTDKEVVLPDAWLRNKKDHLITDHKPVEARRGSDAGHNTDNTYPISTILARGYALVTACYGDVSPDPEYEFGSEMQEKIAYTEVFDLWGPRDPQREDNTSSIAAWAWAMSRGLDMIEAEPELDASKVVASGYSRLGKTALVAGVYDERFAVTAPVQSGCGGTTLSKRNFGENVARITGTYPHWFCKAYAKYSFNESSLTFDQHMFMSCIAPRALLVVGYDSNWFDPKGEFIAIKAASPVWTFLGKEGMRAEQWPEDYSTEGIGGSLGYVRRNQGHGIAAIDWLWIMDFADNIFRRND